MKDRAVRLQKVALARRTMQLTPGTTAGMPVGAQVAQPQPTPVVTAWMRTKVLRRVDHTGAPVEREYRSGGHCRCGFGLYGLVNLSTSRYSRRTMWPTPPSRMVRRERNVLSSSS